MDSGAARCSTCPPQQYECVHVKALGWEPPPSLASMPADAFEVLYEKLIDPETSERRITSLSFKQVPLIDKCNQPDDPLVAEAVRRRLSGEDPLPTTLLEAEPQPCNCRAGAHWKVRSGPCLVFGLCTFVEAECKWYQCSGCSREVHYDGGAAAILNQNHRFKYTYELLITYAHRFSSTKGCNFHTFW